MEKKLKIIWNSNAPHTTSGYGTQMGLLLPLIKKEGYPVSCICYYGLDGGKIEIDGIPYYTKLNHLFASDVLPYHTQTFGADVTMTLHDIWILDEKDLAALKRFIPWVPIDMDPIPQKVLSKLYFAYRILTHSKFGLKMLNKAGFNATYIPLSVDTTIFKPIDKKGLRKELGFPEDVFLFGMVAANKDDPPRKAFQECMDAFVMFTKKHPKSGMYFHTSIAKAEGFNILEYSKFLGIANKIWFFDDFTTAYKTDRAFMNKIYNTFDVLLNPAKSEGFGVPIIEAGACGIPSIVNNYSSMPELVIPHVTGEICEVLGKVYTKIGSYWMTPDPKSIYEKMEALFEADRVKMGEKAREFVVENYDTTKVFDKHWKPFLRLLQDEIYGL